MKNAKISLAYAKALFELGNESGLNVSAEMTEFSELINSSNKLENLLFLDVFTISEREQVLKDIFPKTKLSKLIQNFILYLVFNKRIGLLPEIFKNLVVLEDDKKGFLRGTIESHDATMDKATEATIKKFIKENLHREPILTYKQNSKITAGFRVSAGDYLVDATIDNQLEQFKRSSMTL
jgi:F-type H+-transporting ATPase subunit delta